MLIAIVPIYSAISLIFSEFPIVLLYPYTVTVRFWHYFGRMCQEILLIRLSYARWQAPRLPVALSERCISRWTNKSRQNGQLRETVPHINNGLDVETNLPRHYTISWKWYTYHRQIPPRGKNSIYRQICLIIDSPGLAYLDMFSL